MKDATPPTSSTASREPGTKRPSWARFFIESFVIVFSILLAFFVDASWDRVQQRDRERDYTLALRNEFTAANSELASSLQYRSIIAQRVLNLLLQAQGAPRAPEDSLYYWSSALSQQLDFDPPRAVLDDIVSSGETGIIADSLRLALATYRSLLETQRRRDDQAWGIWENRIQPLLEGRIPRTNRLILGTFGADYELPFDLSRHRADWSGVLGDPVFEDVLAERWMRLELASFGLRKLETEIEEISGMIDRRLRKLDQVDAIPSI